MAGEKISIFEIDINFDAAIKDTAKYKQEAEKLKEELKELKKNEGELSQSYVKKKAELAAVNDQVRQNENVTKKLTAAQREGAGTIQKLEAANAKLRNEQRKLDLTTRQGIKRNQEINKEIEKNTNIIRKNSDQEKQRIMNIGNYTSAMGQSGVAVNAATSAVKTFGTVLKVALGPFGLIIAAVAALISYFKRSEEGQNAWMKVMKIFNVVVENLADILSKVGKQLYEAITQPRQAWEDFKDFIRGLGEFFTNTFGNIIGGAIDAFVAQWAKDFAQVGLAWQKFKGIFVENSEAIQEAQQKVTDKQKEQDEAIERMKLGATNLKDAAVNAYETIKDKIIEVVEETKREIEIASRLADLQASIDKRTRKNIVDEAKERVRLAEIRNQLADKDNVAAERRLELVDEENRILDEQSQRVLKLLKDKLYLKQVENKLSESTKEDLMEEAQLRADVFNKEAEIEEKRKASIKKRLEAEREIAQDAIKLLDSEVKAFIAANKDKFQDYQRLFELEKAALDEQLNRNLIKQNEYNNKLFELETKRDEAILARQLEVETVNFENRKAIAENRINEMLALDLQALEMQRQQEIEAAERIGADVASINEKYRIAEIELNRAAQNSKLAIAEQFAGQIAQLAGESTFVGKLAASAQALVNTYLGATAAFAQTPGGIVIKSAAAGLATAIGLANVASIWKVKSGLPGDKSGGGATASGGAATPRAATAPTIGQGIISRTTNNMTNQTQIVNTPVLVVDEVTANQNRQMSQNATGVL